MTRSRQEGAREYSQWCGVRGIEKYTMMLCFLCIFLLLNGCHLKDTPPSEEITRYETNFEIIGSEKGSMLEDVSEAIFKTSDRSNQSAEEVQIADVDKGDITVPSGRYTIVGERTGNVYIHDENGGLLFHDIVGSPYGVESITVDLDETYTIHMDGFEYAAVIPAPTELSTELTAGIWHVGKDIEAGSYTISAPYGFGYLQIFDPETSPQVYEVISNQFATTNSKVRLKEGQKLRITNISAIEFD